MRCRLHAAAIGLFLVLGMMPHAMAEPSLSELHQQVRALYKAGRDEEGVALAEKTVTLVEKAHGVESPAICDTLYLLARGYTRTGELAKAEPVHQRVVKIRTKALGPDHPDTATAIYNLAWFHANMADYRKADELFHQALAIREKQFGAESRWTAECLNSLAVLQENTGHYAESEKLYQQALIIQRQVLGADHFATATTLNNLASLYWTLGDYEQAERDFNESFNIRKKALGLEHPDTVTSLNNLALLYRSLGDYTRAEPLLKRVLALRRKILGPQHAATVTSLSHLGLLYAAMGDDARAEPLLTQVRAMRENMVGLDHPDTARSDNDLGLLYDRRRQFAKAEPLLVRSLEGRLKTLGARHPETALSLRSLARHFHLLGNFPQAEKFYIEALGVQRTALGVDHPDTLATMEGLAWLQSETGRRDAALELARETTGGMERRFNRLFSFTSERQRLELLKTVRPLNLPAGLACPKDTAQTALRTKGIVLDSLLEDQVIERAAQDPELKSLLVKLRDLSRRLSEPGGTAAGDGSEQTDPGPASRESLEEQQKQIESSIARRVTGLGRIRRALAVETDAVRAAIPAGSALVEFIRYEHHLGRLRFENRYGAVVMSRDGETQWVALGKAEEIEARIHLYQKHVRRNVKKATLTKLLQQLGRDLWEPVAATLPEGTRTVIISPDGELNFVSFATLLTKGDRFLAEERDIQYVTSGRDLLRGAARVPESREAAVFADPAFGSRAGRGRAEPVTLGPLPGSRREAVFLSGHASSWGLTPSLNLGPHATKAALAGVRSPRILHLATHGLFLDETDFPRVNFLRSPMRRSVLALAGAQKTLDAWAAGRVPKPEDDGIVSAEEVADLDLKQTWLVVLSACDSATGEAQAGEGVLGLRRGFIRAGAENLMMTLWPVGDEATYRIVEDFYDEAMRTGDPSRSLASVQRKWLVQLRKEQGIAMAVRLAGPFILTRQGRGE